MIIIVELSDSLHNIGKAALTAVALKDAKFIFFTLPGAKDRIWANIIKRCLPRETQFEVRKGVPAINSGEEVIVIGSDFVKRSVAGAGAKVVDAPTEPELVMPSQIEIAKGKYDIHVGYFDNEDAAHKFMEHLKGQEGRPRLILFTDVVPRGEYKQVDNDTIVGDIYETTYPGIYMCRYFPGSFEEGLSVIKTSLSPMGVCGASSKFIAGAAGLTTFEVKKETDKKIGGAGPPHTINQPKAIDPVIGAIITVILIIIMFVVGLLFEGAASVNFGGASLRVVA